MVNLVIGAAASGKSEYAEDIVMSLPGEKIYIATMEPFGAERKTQSPSRRKGLHYGREAARSHWSDPGSRLERADRGSA